MGKKRKKNHPKINNNMNEYKAYVVGTDQPHHQITDKQDKRKEQNVHAFCNLNTFFTSFFTSLRPSAIKSVSESVI